jgi:hypothetical protein
MKKFLGALFVAGTLVVSAACASSGTSGKPASTDSGEQFSAMARPVEQPRGQSTANSQDDLTPSDANVEAGTLR